MTAGIIALIPARGGSKGIPRKNLALVAGKPLIVWTIEAARASASVGRVIVSTEDTEIAEVARRFAAEVPFERPRGLAQDETPGIEPALHALSWLETHEGASPDYLMVLQPTSPLRTADDIDGAIRLAQEREAETVVSVCPARPHPSWMKRVTAEGRLVPWAEGDDHTSRRQDLAPAYMLNGAIYLARPEVLTRHRSFYTDRTYAYVMPPERSVDIDEELDLVVAESLLKDRMADARD